MEHMWEHLKLWGFIKKHKQYWWDNNIEEDVEKKKAAGGKAARIPRSISSR
jgi:hypothetical protein